MTVVLSRDTWSVYDHSIDGFLEWPVLSEALSNQALDPISLYSTCRVLLGDGEAQA